MTSIPIAVDVALHRDYIDVIASVKVLDKVRVAVGEHTMDSALCQSLEEVVKANMILHAEPARLVACEG